MFPLSPVKASQDISALLIQGQSEVREAAYPGKNWPSFQAALQESLGSVRKHGFEIMILHPVKMGGDDNVTDPKKGTGQGKAIPTDLESAAAAAAWTNPFAAGVVNFMPDRTLGEDQTSVATAGTKTELLFKARIADVLVKGGCDRGRAERITDQIRRIEFVKEMTLCAKDDHFAPSGKMMPADRAGSSPIHPAEKAPSALKNEAPVKEMLSGQKREINAQINSFAVGREQKENLPEGAASAASTHDNVTTCREVFHNSPAGAPHIRGDLETSGVLPLRQKNRHLEQERTQNFTTPAVYPVGAPTDGDGPAFAEPVRAEEIIAQIADLRNAQPDQTGRVKIVLDPPGLGTVDMDIIVRGESVSAVMTTDNRQVQHILRSHMEEMRMALNDQGFRLDRIEVREGQEQNDPSSQNHGRGGDHQSGGGYQSKQERHPQGLFSLGEVLAQLNTTA